MGAWEDVFPIETGSIYLILVSHDEATKGRG